MARQIQRVVTFAILAALLLSVQAAWAAVPAEFEGPISDGLGWLASQQDQGDGSFGEYARVEQTSLAVMKMLDRSRELGEQDPLAGLYGSQIQRGLGFIISKVRRDEPDKGSIWDYHSYPLGSDPSPPPIVTETSSAILALTSTGTPGATAWTEADGTPVSYRKVVGDAVDYLKSAQMNGVDEDGGWTSFYQDPWLMPPSGPCTEMPGEEKCLRSPLEPDQWNSGIATFALVSAENKFDIPMGSPVREGLGKWVDHVQFQLENDPSIAPSTNLAWTGYLLYQGKAAGFSTGDPRIESAVQNLVNQWNAGTPDTNPGPWNYMVLFTTMKGLDAWGQTAISGSDWFDIYTRKIMREQNDVSGYWSWGSDEPLQCILPTEWALLVLEGRGLPAPVPNRPPVAEGQSVATDEGIDLPITLHATDEDGDHLMYAIEASPSHGTLDLNLPGLTYTPAPDFSGEDSFTFSAYDGIDHSNIATVVITVRPVVVTVNGPPVAKDQSIVTNEDTPVTFSLDVSDPEGDPLSYTIVAAPLHGTLAGTGPEYTYTPVPHYYGSDGFTFQANDGLSDSNLAVATISVSHLNHPPDTHPAAPSSSCLWPPNHKFAELTIGGIRDPDGDPLTVTITKITSDEAPYLEKGSGGKTHSPDASGIGTGTATLLRAERSGNNNGRVYAITFEASDGKGGMAEGTVTVCVPHDQSTGCTCSDDGQGYDATSVN